MSGIALRELAVGLIAGALAGYQLATYFKGSSKKEVIPPPPPPQVTPKDETYEESDKNHLNRLPARGTYDKATVHQILQSAHFCHVAFLRHNEETGQSHVVSLPTLYGVKDDYLFIHGHSANGMIRQSLESASVSISVALLDGLVYARTLFHSSVNYRSVVIFGKASLVTDETEKNEALAVISDNIMPGRWKEARLPNKTELKATSVLKISIDYASAKIREGPPKDDKIDIETLKVWSGVLPIHTVRVSPVTDPSLLFELPPSPSFCLKKQ